LFAFQLRGATPRHGLTYRNGYATRSPGDPQAAAIAMIAEGICALLHPVPGGIAAAAAVRASRMVIRTVRPGANSVGRRATGCFDRKSVRFQHIHDDPVDAHRSSERAPDGSGPPRALDRLVIRGFVRLARTP
jgi:hypothetical protein